MSKQSSKTIFGASNNIMRDATHFVTVSVKVPKANISVDEDGYLTLKAGTIVSTTGVIIPATAITADTPSASLAYGIVYEDYNFDDVPVGQSEPIPVVIHGVVLASALSGTATADIKAALKDIQLA